MIKLLSFSFLFILAISNSVFSQTEDSSDLPKLRLTVFAEKTIWSENAPAVVRFSIENLSGETVTLPASIYFTLADLTGENRIGKNSLYSPVSLTKRYDEGTNSCQNDLSKERTTMNGILPPPWTFVLEKGEKKEVSLDFKNLCWQRLISSVYADRNLFSVAKTGKYKLSFKVGFQTGKAEKASSSVNDAAETKIVKRVASNEIEIEIK